MKILGLRARSRRDIAVAAGAVRRYVEAGMSPSLAGYYNTDVGVARGLAAAGLGMRGAVAPAQLEQLLAGEHPVVDAVLLSGSGSAARSLARHRTGLPDVGDPDETLTLAEAAKQVGVSRRYLSSLIATTPRLVFPVATTDIDPRVAAKLVGVLTGSPLDSPGKDYLVAGRGESGEWRITRGELARFIATRQVPETVLGFDLTLAAPKSVSLLWAFADPAMRAEIAAAVDAAVDAAVGYLERHAAVGKIAGRDTHGIGLAVASYVHEWSRNDDPHLHVHNVIINAVPIALVDADGHPVRDDAGQPRVEWRALDSTMVLRHHATAGHLAAAELRHQLSTRLGVEWGPVRNGLADIATFPRELLEAFSTRHRDVAAEYQELLDAGIAPGKATEAMAQRGSRRAKHGPVDPTVAVERLARLGWTPEAVAALIPGAGRRVDELTAVELDATFTRLVGPSGLTERDALFDRRHVIQHLATAIGDRATAIDVEGYADRFLADRRIVMCASGRPARRGELPEPVYTTEDLLSAEATLVAAIVDGVGAAPRAQVPAVDVEEAILTVNASIRRASGDPDGGLDVEQAAMVRNLCASTDRVRLVHGPAGTGKTEALRAAVAAWQQAGVPVVAAANGGSHTQTLGERLGVRAEVVASWITRLTHSADPATVWVPGTVVIVDEATQVSTRDMATLTRYACTVDAVIVAVGDPAQLSSVGAGGWFIHAVSHAQTAGSLSVLHRQSADSMREVRTALNELRSELPGDAAAAMGRLARDGRVRLFDTRDALVAQVVDDWYQDRTQRLNNTASGGRRVKVSTMMAAHHHDVDTLNQAARTRLAADGTLTGPTLVAARRSYQVGDEVVTLTQAGHTLRPAGTAWRTYIRTGTTGVVTAIHHDPDHPDRQHLTVDFAERGTVQVPWSYLTHEFTDGRCGGLGHAYAYTADRAQGATMAAARAVTDDTTTKAAFYVMASRGQTDLAAYLVRRDRRHDHPDDERWLPVLPPPGLTLDRVIDRLRHSTGERLVADHDPHARRAHLLASGHTIAELHALRATAAGDDAAVVERAEHEALAAACAAARTNPDPDWVSRLGPRPHHGDARLVWDHAVDAITIYQSRWTPTGRSGHWALGPRPDPDPRPDPHRTTGHDDALAVVTAWADRLGDIERHGFWTASQTQHRERAVAGVQALLEAGWLAPAVAEHLARTTTPSTHRGAALLEHHVERLCTITRTEPNVASKTAPHPASVEWDRAATAVHRAEVRHLTDTRTPAQLHAVRDQLVDQTRLHARLVTIDDQLDAARHELERAPRHIGDSIRRTIAALQHERHGLAATAGHLDIDQPRLVADAIEQHVTDSLTRIHAGDIPTHLHRLLGPRPTQHTDEWDARAEQIERHRITVLGVRPDELHEHEIEPLSRTRTRQLVLGR